MLIICIIHSLEMRIAYKLTYDQSLFRTFYFKKFLF